MFPFILAAALATAAPTTCPSDLQVANPRLRVVRALDKTLDNYVVTVAIVNRGVAAQPDETRQHLALVRNKVIIGTQPIPSLGANENFDAAFRLQLPHQRPRPPFTVEFRYVLDSHNARRANCTSANDRLTATL